MLSLAVLVGTSTMAYALQSGRPLRAPDVNTKVANLFAEMRAGKCPEHPEANLDWADIPALLKLAGNKTQLRSFPINPVSSMLVDHSTEGLVALWLIEGVRREHKRLPSLNALLTPFKQGDDYVQVSESRQSKVAGAYVAWWNHAKTMAKDQAIKIDPLAGTGLTWYGSGH